MRRARHGEVGRSVVVFGLAALVVVGCSRSPREQSKKGIESLHSWAVSAQMVGERWMEGAVPVPYANKTLQTFGRKMRREREKISSGKLPSGVQEFLVAGFDSAARSTDSLLAVVDRDDKRAAARIVGRLSRQARAADYARARFGAK